MEVFNAVYLVGGVHSERNPIQRLAADHAREAVRVVWLACCSQQLTENMTAVNTSCTECSQSVTVCLLLTAVDRKQTVVAAHNTDTVSKVLQFPRHSQQLTENMSPVNTSCTECSQGQFSVTACLLLTVVHRKHVTSKHFLHGPLTRSVKCYSWSVAHRRQVTSKTTCKERSQGQ